MGEMKTLFADRLSDLVTRANSIGIKKEQIVTILPFEDSYGLIYYN